MVGVGQKPGIHLHQSRCDALALLGQRVPRGKRLVALGQLGIGGNHPQPLLPGEDLLAQHVPALVEAAPERIAPLRRHMVGRVGRAGAQ